jgi:hypothetical protein
MHQPCITSGGEGAAHALAGTYSPPGTPHILRPIVAEAPVVAAVLLLLLLQHPQAALQAGAYGYAPGGD